MMSHALAKDQVLLLAAMPQVLLGRALQPLGAFQSLGTFLRKMKRIALQRSGMTALWQPVAFQSLGTLLRQMQFDWTLHP
jgi:hypothetical protein